MTVEQQLDLLNSKIDKIGQVLESYSGLIGRASLLQKKGIKPRFKERLTKADARAILVKYWNEAHPLYKIEN